MHSALNRAQSVFGFFTTVAFVLGVLTAVSVTLLPAEPVSSVELTNVQVYVLFGFMGWHTPGRWADTIQMLLQVPRQRS